MDRNRARDRFLGRLPTICFVVGLAALLGGGLVVSGAAGEKETRITGRSEWLFVAADNRCYTSSVLGEPFTEEGAVPARAQGKGGQPLPASQTAGQTVPGSMLELGRKVFAENCAMCHHPDKKETKVGPGLKGLFKRRVTPVRRLPVTEENIRAQIQEGGEQMPPYSHIKGQALSALLIYLKSL